MSRLVLDWLVMRARRRPDDPALSTLSATWSWRQLLDAADGLACALADAGLERGDRVASLLRDDAPAVVLIHAARRLGLTVVLLNRRLTPTELRGQLEIASVGTLIHDAGHAGLAADVVPDPASRHRVEALLAGASCIPRDAQNDRVDLDGAAAIVFTSGTTGRPKGALLTHGNLAASAHAWANLLGPRDTDRWLACLPLFHVAGLAMVTRTARWGVELQVMERFDGTGVSAALDAGVSHLSLVPAQLSTLLAVREGQAVPPTLRAILLGGGPIPSDLLARARGAGYPVLTTYGLTETASGIAVGDADPATLADPGAGRLLQGAEVRIEPAGAPDAAGAILVRGPMVFPGYIGENVTSGDRFRDGWFDTGDIGRLDDDGLLHIVDRRDDLIISGGENVYPAEVETVLREHVDVVDAVVYGQPHATWGVAPVAAVVVRPGARLADEELARFCRERLAGYKVPTRFRRVTELPRDGLGKVRRRDLPDALDEAPT